MKKSDLYKRKIQSSYPGDLLKLWDNICSNTVSKFWAEGKALEYLVLRAFEIEGAEVEWPDEIRDKNNNKVIEQIDGVIYYKAIASIIECKDTSEPIDYEPIAKLRSQLLRRPIATIASVFSLNGYTTPALILARYNTPQTILLWDGNEIEYALANGKFCEGIEIKYRNFVQRGHQDINIAFYNIKL